MWARQIKRGLKILFNSCRIPTQAMPLFSRPHYTSGITEFIDQLKTHKPELESKQRQGRSIWWDSAIDREDQREFQQARVAQKAYVYQTTGHPNSQ